MNLWQKTGRSFGCLLITFSCSVNAAYESSLSSPGSRSLSDRAFNPAISLILDGQYGSYSNDARERDVPGFQLGEESGGFEEGFTLNESELNLQANIDDKFFAFATVALESEAGDAHVALEEAWLQTLALPAGLQLKAGRFFSGVGYLNGFHPHATDFADDPLAYRVFFDGRLADTGVQMTWTPATLLYMQFGAELMAGNSFPAAGASNDGVGTRTLFAKFGGDVTASHSWLAGVSRISAEAIERGSGGTAEETGVDPLFTGDTDMWIGSLVWKWAPRGNAANRNFRFTAELVDRDEDGLLSLNGATGSYRGDASGYYLEGVYRFRRQWHVGLRYGHLKSDNTISGIATPTVLERDGFEPKQMSAMIDFRNSEFSMLRLQYTRDRSNPVEDDQLILQYVMSMGAHGGHTF